MWMVANNTTNSQVGEQPLVAYPRLLKVKSLCLFNYAPCHEDVWECGGMATPLLTSVLGVEWSASRPGRFTPWERDCGTHGIENCVGPRAGLDAVKKEKSLALNGNWTRAVQPVARRYGVWLFTAQLHSYPPDGLPRPQTGDAWWQGAHNYMKLSLLQTKTMCWDIPCWSRYLFMALKCICNKAYKNKW
jgi:hypothetical protein